MKGCSAIARPLNLLISCPVASVLQTKSKEEALREGEILVISGRYFPTLYTNDTNSHDIIQNPVIYLSYLYRGKQQKVSPQPPFERGAEEKKSSEKVQSFSLTNYPDFILLITEMTAVTKITRIIDLLHTNCFFALTASQCARKCTSTHNKKVFVTTNAHY